MSKITSSHQWIALALTVVTTSAIFARRVLVLQKYCAPPKPYHYITYAISILSGLVFWTSLNMLSMSVVVQLLFGVTSTTLSWVVLVLLVNERLKFPSRQQWMSLVFYVLTEASFLIQVRLLFNERNA